MDENDGTTLPDPRGGGDSEMVSPTRPIPDLKLLRRAILNQWAIPAHVYETLPKQVTDILNGADGVRERIAAAKLLVTMHKDNVDSFVQVDKVDRLDTGMATERFELVPIRLTERG